MEYRILTTKDYLTLCEWWAIQKFRPPTLDDLPMVNGEIQGIMVSHDGEDIWAGFLIDMTIANAAMFEYPVANFYVKDREIRTEAFNFMMARIAEIAKGMGKKYIYMSLKQPALLKRMLGAGFQEGTKNTSELVLAV